MTKAMTYFSISSMVLIEEAKKLWLETEIISENKNLFYIRWNWKEYLFKSTDFWWNSALWFKIANDKELTYKLLEKNNLPIAKSWYINKKELSKMEEYNIDFPVIIKPVDEWHWNWVMMNILNKKELILKLEKSFTNYENMIIQKQVEWKEYRIIIMEWKVILAINRIPAHVKWDWVNSIKELIDKENKENSLRWSWYECPLSNIEINKELISYISKKWLDINKIPKNWEYIQLRWNSNLWTWWTLIDITNKICDDIKNIVIKCTKLLWLKLAWVDIITNDILIPLEKSWWIILEINATPWIWWHKELSNINTWKIILEELFFNKEYDR